MKIEILGTGCKKCENVYENTLSAVSQFDDSYGIEVQKVTDITYFAKVGVFITPAILIDGQVISSGKVLSSEQIKNKIEEKI